MNRLRRHIIQQLLHQHGEAELPLHQITKQVEQVIAETLEHEEIRLDIVLVLAVLLHRAVDLLEESLA